MSAFYLCMEKGEGPLFSPSPKQKIPSSFEEWEVFLSGHITSAGGKRFLFME